MKNNDNDRLLKHKQQVDQERRAQAILRKRQRAQATAQAMANVARLRGAAS
jgi:hypothetical protein